MRSEAQRSVLENPSSAEPEADLWDNLGLREPKGSLERRALPVTERLSCTPHYLREHYFRLTDEEMGSEVKSPAQGYLGGRICLSNLIQIPSSTLCVCVGGGSSILQVPALVNILGCSGLAAWPSQPALEQAAVAIPLFCLTEWLNPCWHCGDVGEPPGPVSIWPWPLSQRFGKAGWKFKTAESTAGSH